MTAEALDHLRKSCTHMRRTIKAIGPCTLVPEPDRTPFRSLIQAVAHQQLHGAAAETILRRFRALFGNRFPTPVRLAEVSDEQLRGVGFSRAKVAASQEM